MAGGRTLVVNLVANTNSFSRGMMSAVRNAEGFGGKMSAIGGTLNRVLGPALLAAGAAAGALAIKMGVDGVKAAMENERTASVLAQTLQNLGQAHRQTGVEEFIAKLESATGVVDDKLRPALGRLVIATGDVDEAQSLLQKSMDAGIGLNKDFATVAEAVAKAVQTGNAGALSRYGIVVDDNTVKTAGFTAAVNEALDAFKGLQAAEARTLQGQLRILQVEADNVKEAFGRGLLSAFEDSRGGLDDLAESLRGMQEAAEDAGEAIGNTVNTISDGMTALKGLTDWVSQTREEMGPLGMVVESLASSLYQVTNPLMSLVDVFTAVTGSSDNSSTSLDGYKDAAVRATGPTSGLSGELNALADEADDAAMKFEILNGYLSSTRAILSYESAWADLSGAIDGSTFTMSKNTEEGRKNHENLLRFAERTAQLAATQDTMAEKINTARDSLGRLSGVMNKTEMSPEQRAKLLAPFQALIDDLRESGADVDRLQGKINSLKGKTIDINFRTNWDNLPAAARREWYGVATGGLIKGPGGPKADMVGPFMLSNGEFVVQSSAVSKFGVDFFEKLNRGINPLGSVDVPGPSRPSQSSGRQGMVIQNLNVTAAPGERAESSVPRSLRRMAWVSGLDG
jgi:hypothetical protein